MNSDHHICEGKKIKTFLTGTVNTVDLIFYILVHFQNNIKGVSAKQNCLFTFQYFVLQFDFEFSFRQFCLYRIICAEPFGSTMKQIFSI